MSCEGRGDACHWYVFSLLYASPVSFSLCWPLSKLSHSSLSLFIPLACPVSIFPFCHSSTFLRLAYFSSMHSHYSPLFPHLTSSLDILPALRCPSVTSSLFLSHFPTIFLMFFIGSIYSKVWAKSYGVAEAGESACKRPLDSLSISKFSWYLKYMSCIFE